MEPKGLLPYSHVLATCPYPKPARSSPYTHFTLTEIHLNMILPSKPGFSSCLFPSGFPTKTLYTPLLYPIRATCPTHLIPLNLIAQIRVGEQYRSFSSSLCSFLQSPVTSSLLGPNTLLNTLFQNTLNLRSSLNISDQVLHP